jgi:hypothetical protein
MGERPSGAGALTSLRGAAPLYNVSETTLGVPLLPGGVAERTIARLLKSLGPKGPGVRIPPPPQVGLCLKTPDTQVALESDAPDAPHEPAFAANGTVRACKATEESVTVT